EGVAEVHGRRPSSTLSSPPRSDFVAKNMTVQRARPDRARRQALTIMRTPRTATSSCARGFFPRPASQFLHGCLATTIHCQAAMREDACTRAGASMVTGSEHPFTAPYAPADEAIAARLLADAARAPAAESRIDARATRLIEGIRSRAGGLGGIEDFLHAYSLSTKEGLALMVLAEALLRVPDAATADRLIEDKLA